MRLAITMLSAAVGFGQAAFTFDVATVKPNKTDSRAMFNHVDPKRASWTHYTLETLMQIAYAYEDTIGEWAVRRGLIPTLGMSRPNQRSR